MSGLGQLLTRDASSRWSAADWMGAMKRLASWLQRPRVIVGFVGVLVLVALLAPVDPLTQYAGSELRPPSFDHPFGTDAFGRDVFGRVVVGSRFSILLGLCSAALGGSVGTSMGMLAAYRGGVLDAIVMRLFDAFLALPSLLTGIVAATIMGPGLATVVITAAIVTAPLFARIARISVRSEMTREYVVAALAVGVRPPRIVLRHILPNVMTPLLTQAVLAVAFAVLLEASLSFLGLGIRRPDPSWGVMLDDSRNFLRQAPWMAIAPAGALVALLGSLTILGDAVSDLFSPRRVQQG